MAKDQKVYMPLMIGDWLKGTLGMKAEVRGVYINLLLYQWDNGFIPSDMEELCLIDPELPKVWDKLKHKFSESEPGKLQNKKAEDVRAFWQKQRKNGGKGGRPKKENLNNNLNNNPKENPNTNHHNDLDLDNDLELKNKKESRENVSRGTDDIDFTSPDVDGDELTFPVDTKPIRELWAKWKEYRYREFGMRYPMMGEQADLKRLTGLSPPDVERTILTAMANKWKNLYPDYNRNGASKNTKSKHQQQIDSLVAGFAARHGATTDPG